MHIIIPATRPLREAIARFDEEARNAQHTVEGLALLAGKIRALMAADLMPFKTHETAVLLAGLNALIDEEAERVSCFKVDMHNEVAALTPMTGGETC